MLRDHRHKRGPSLTETSLRGAYPYCPSFLAYDFQVFSFSHVPQQNHVRTSPLPVCDPILRNGIE